MKKTVVLILILLPIVLLLVIALAGRVLSTYQRIDVESVVFIDELGEELDESSSVTVNHGETRQTRIRIYPELATDKRVSYTSADEKVCTVDSEGVLTGVGAGSTVIMVKTTDGGKTSALNVIVRADRVTGVELSPEALNMMIGDSTDLKVSVEPFAALNKKVFYTVSDPSVVSVSATGRLRAIGAGTAIVTVTTEDGGFTDTCTVTVVDDTPPIFFDFTDTPGIQQAGTGYISTEGVLDLTAALRTDENIDKSEVSFRIIQGDGASVDENGVLTFTHSGVVVIEAYATDENTLTCRAEIRIAWFE